MQRERTGKTLSEDVYLDLHRQIVGGKLQPGSRLKLKDIADAQGVSLSVVREAVTRLAADGLAEAVPQVGFRVRSLSLEDMLDLTWTRVHIETIALRESIERGDLAWEAEVMAAHHRLANTPLFCEGEDGDDVNPAWMREHSSYHEVIVSACTSRHLLRVRRQLFDAAELYRYWSSTLYPSNFERRTVDIEGEHAALLDAALARDADEAVRILTAHLRHTAESLSDAVAANGGLAGDPNERS